MQRTYQKALDNAHEQYGSEERAHRTAWDAVKHVAEKKGDRWVLKDETGPSDPHVREARPAARRGGRTYGGVDVFKPKEELYEDAKRAGIEGRSRMTKQELAEALARHSQRATARARS